MARIRTIKPEFFTSEDIVELTMPARLLYIALWCEADREGRLVWKPKTFKLRYFPADSIDIDAVAQELLSGGLVVLYGNGLAHIPQFSKHQHLNPRESQSTLAPPPGAIVTELDPTAPDIHASARVSDASVTREHATVTHREEGKGREGEGKEGQEQERRALAESAAAACKAMIEGGVPPTRINQSLPALLALVEDPRATPAMFRDTAREGPGKPMQWVVATIAGRLGDAARPGKLGRAANAFARTNEQKFEPGALTEGRLPSWLEGTEDARASV